MALITDTMIELAFSYLNDCADAAAKARADRVLAEHRRKKVLAELILAAPKTISSDLKRKSWAESSPEYWKACQAEANAIQADIWHIHQRERCIAIIEAWRSEQANLRGASKI